MVAVVVLVGAARCMLGFGWVGLMGEGINKLGARREGVFWRGRGVWTGLEGEGFVDCV